MGQHGWKLISICLLSFGLVHPYYAEGHNKAIIQCRQNIVYDRAIKIGDDVISKDFYLEHYDTNNDGKFDIQTLSYRDLAVHNANPVFWMVDLDYDGEADVVYIDKKGLGICTDIVLYEDLNNLPYTEEKPMLNRGGRL